jgi:hypothetical protein
MTAPTLTDTPESAMDDGRCSYDVNGGHPGESYDACGQGVVATWYAVQWPGRTRTPIAALCAIHDRHAQRATDALPFTQRTYVREEI